MNGGRLEVTIHGSAPGITYTAQSSTDAKTWTTDGVTIPSSTRISNAPPLSLLLAVRSI